MHGGAYFARWVRFLLGRTFEAADRSPLSWGYGVMADTADSKPVVERRVGSSPTSPTKLLIMMMQNGGLDFSKMFGGNANVEKSEDKK